MMLVGFVMVITAVTMRQDTVTNRDTVPPVPVPVPAAPVAPTPTPPPPPPEPTIEQIRYMEGLKTATRGIAQIRDGLNRVVRTASADSVTRTRAAKRLGGLCGSGRSFIASGRPKMQSAAYSDSLRILAKQVTTRLDSLSNAASACEKTAGRDPATVTTNLTAKLKSYDDALLAFRNAQAALNKPDSTKTVSQQ
ncbi:MAG TPA: hypothetical protein VFO67_10535 [Gemmatimonadales bacterium]|nr:hypothetical protein [Gemmatimonadales bacterium]